MKFSFVLVKAAIDGLTDGQTHGQIASKTRAEDMSVFFGFNQTIGCIGQWDITAVINQLCNVAKVVTDELTKRFVAP